MQKIVIDTNVIVSSLIQRSYPYYIINEFFGEKKFLLCVSDELLTEYHEVLTRTKFSKYPDFLIRAKSILATIEMNARNFQPKTRIDIITDKDDNKLLELSSASRANFLITGNTNDFTIKKYKKTKIVTPRDYWENYRPE